MTRPALIGDIGGTNARFALVTPDTFAPRDIQSLPCADYPGLVEAVRDYLARVEELVGVPVDIISTGPERSETIMLRHPFEA